MDGRGRFFVSGQVNIDTKSYACGYKARCMWIQPNIHMDTWPCMHVDLCEIYDTGTKLLIS